MDNQIFDKLTNNICKIISSEDSHGTGFLISEKLIITAYHVVKDCKKIKSKFYNNQIFDVKIHNVIDKEYKKLDIAILELPELIPYKHIDIIDCKLNPKTKWISRGYPSSKSENGENLIDDGNYINAQIETLENGKIDLNLDFKQKLDSYNGLSGAPLIVDNNIVGIINSQLDEKGKAKELNGLSIKNFMELFDKIGIKVKKTDINSINSNKDLLSSERWTNLTKPEDARNLKEKILSVCSDMSTRKINNYNNKVVLGKEEQLYYDERDISAIKYIIFDKCQVRLLDFYDDNTKKELSKDEIKIFLENYLIDAKFIVEDKRQEYNYPNFCSDFLEKIILDLIDECFLSFDEDGIYE